MSKTRVEIVEESKATREVRVCVVTDFHTLADRPGMVSYRCPNCHRRAAGSRSKTHRHSCGATIVFEPQQIKEPEQNKE